MPGSLSDSAAEVVRALLVQLGIAGEHEAPWPAYVGVEPGAPDDCITVYDTAGVAVRTDAWGERAERQGVQIRVRAAVHSDAAARAHGAAVALDSAIGVVVAARSGATYGVAAVIRRSGPVYIGDESPTSRRHLFTVNAVISLRRK